MKTTLLKALLVASLVTSPAAAETLKKVPATLDPDKAYVLVEYKLQENTMSGFPGSRKYVPLTAGLMLARYDPVLMDVRGLGSATSNPVPGDQQALERFRNRQLVKGEASRLFLLEVEPDTWVVQGWGTTSFSLGSYTFRLEPGSITDLGVVEAAADWAEDQRPADTGDVFVAALLGPFAKRPDVAPARVSFRERGEQDLPIPAELRADRVRPVEFTPGATFGNYLGGLVNRIEGVNARLKAQAAADVTF